MVYLIRGLPKTGKSTYAKSLNVFHIEADMFFMKDGVYVYNKESIRMAHEWCYLMFSRAVDVGMDVAVANTFTTMKEISPYIKLCRDNFIPFKIIRLDSIKGDNGHNVPQDTIRFMRERFIDIDDETIKGETQ